MPDRKSLIATVWLSFSLTLLASVLITPTRISGFATASSRPECVRRDFAVSPGRATRLTAAPADKNASQVVGLDTDDEERDDEQESGWILPRVLLRPVPPRSFSRVTHHGLVASHLAQAYFPLLC